MKTISQRIAAFTSVLNYDQIPANVQEKSKVSLLHNLGVALAGESLVGASLKYAHSLGEQGPNPAPHRPAWIFPNTAYFIEPRSTPRGYAKG
jgi:hypothetical protein